MVELKWPDARMAQACKHGSSHAGTENDTRPFRFVTATGQRRKKGRRLADDASMLMTTFRANQQLRSTSVTKRGDPVNSYEHCSAPPSQNYSSGNTIRHSSADLGESPATASTAEQIWPNPLSQGTGFAATTQSPELPRSTGRQHIDGIATEQNSHLDDGLIGREPDTDSIEYAWYEPEYSIEDVAEHTEDYTRNEEDTSHHLALARYVHGQHNEPDEDAMMDSPAYGSSGGSGSSDESPFHRFPLSPVVRYGSFAKKVAAVLDMYDQEFCILPLSEDVRSNPFRVQRDTCEGSAFLLHAVLALASQHLAKQNKSPAMVTQMHSHQATAVRLFSEAVAYTPAFTALDTLLLLVNFEATQTASSTWGVHLGGAFNIIEGIGIEVVCQRSSRTRAQIAMLVWWDVTIALISRRAPRFPARYLETLLHYSSEDGWSWVSLNGCPVELVMFMARLARLAAIYEKTIDMEWTSFDHTPVRQIMREIPQWKNPDDLAKEADILLPPPPYPAAEGPHHESGPGSGNDEEPDAQLNRLHCTEAWRKATLLFAYRVFFRRNQTTSTGDDAGDGGGSSSSSTHEDSLQHRRRRQITILSRQILDHVRCIPSTAIVQKQTLLPVFLAAAEITVSTSDFEATRDFVRNYCRHWSATARYGMFTTVGILLERVWADADPAVGTTATESLAGSGVGDTEPRDEYWWGCTVGQTDFGSPSSGDATVASVFSHAADVEDGLLASELLLG